MKYQTDDEIKNFHGVYPIIEDEDGNWVSSPFVVYGCPKCGRTLKHPSFSTYQPNTFCHHNDAIYQMGVIAEWPNKEPEPKEGE